MTHPGNAPQTRAKATAEARVETPEYQIQRLVVGLRLPNSKEPGYFPKENFTTVAAGAESKIISQMAEIAIGRLNSDRSNAAEVMMWLQQNMQNAHPTVFAKVAGKMMQQIDKSRDSIAAIPSIYEFVEGVHREVRAAIGNHRS